MNVSIFSMGVSRSNDTLPVECMRILFLHSNHAIINLKCVFFPNVLKVFGNTENKIYVYMATCIPLQEKSSRRDLPALIMLKYSVEIVPLRYTLHTIGHLTR